MAMNDNRMTRKQFSPASNNDDETLLLHFFSEQKETIPLEDHGFSQRVMQQLPRRTPLWTRLWSPCCLLLSLLLFIQQHGPQHIWHALQEIFNSQAEQLIPQQFDPKVWIAAGGVLLFLLYRKLSQMA